MDSPNILNAVLERLKPLKHSELDAVAERSGVPVSTVRKIRYGEVENPRVQTVQALYDYFRSQPELAEPTQSERVV